MQSTPSFQHIVVGCDFSTASEMAMREAIALALQHQSRLSILHIAERGLHRRLEGLPRTKEGLKEALHLEAQTQVKRYIQTHDVADFADDRLQILTLDGKPCGRLLQFCDQERADLLVVGQHSTTLLKRLMVGNTAHTLLHDSPIPLLTVAPSHKEGFNTILVAVDFSETSTLALQAAIQMAQAQDATLHVLHVGGQLLDRLSSGNEYKERAQEQFETFLDTCGLQDLPQAHQRHLAFGTPTKEIIQCASTIGCDLLVLGSLGREGLSRLLLGNTAEAIAQTLQCSLLTVRAPKALKAATE